MNFAAPDLYTPTLAEQTADRAYDCATMLDIPYSFDTGATERLDEFNECTK